MEIFFFEIKIFAVFEDKIFAVLGAQIIADQISHDSSDREDQEGFKKLQRADFGQNSGSHRHYLTGDKKPEHRSGFQSGRQKQEKITEERKFSA